MEGMVPRLLIIEDNAGWRDIERHVMKINAQFRTTKDAMRYLDNNPDVDVVVMADCALDGANTINDNVLSLVQTIRQNFHGTIIATSSYDNCGEALVNAGCDVHVLRSRLAQELSRIRVLKGQ